MASSEDVTIEKSTLGGKNFKIRSPPSQPQKTTSPEYLGCQMTTPENKSEQNKNKNAEVSLKLFSKKKN